MARNDNNDSGNNSLVQDVEAKRKLYADNVTHGERFSAAFDSSKILGSDGKLFGLEVSEGAANTLRLLLNQVLPHFADYAGNKSTDLAYNIAKKLGKTDPAELARVSKSWGKGIAYGTIFIQPAAELAANFYQTTNRLNELGSAISPIAKANGSSSIASLLGGGGNEVIDNATRKLRTNAMNDVVSTVARSIGLIPSFYMLHQKQKLKLLEAEQDAELEMLAKGGSAEDYQNYIKKHLGESATFNMEHTKQLQKQLNEAKKEYYAGWEDFKRQQKTKVRTEIQRDDLLREELQARYRSRNSSFYQSPDNKKDNTLIDRLTELRLKEKYVEEHMAWNEEWLSPEQKEAMYKGNGYKPQTLKGTIEEAHNKVLERINEKVHGAKQKSGDKHDAMNDGLLNQGILGVASLGGELLEGLVTKGSNKKLKEAIALDLILHLKRSIDEHPQRESIPGHANHSEEFSYAMFVHKIFQQHQHDCSQSEIGERYVTNLKKDNWNDADIQQKKDSELGTYEVAVKHISQYIRDGRMDPLALINLVGERKIVAPSGKSFGALKTGDEDDVKKSVIAEIDHQCALLKPNHHMSQEDISAALAGYTFSPEELKAAFSSSGLKGDERAFVFTLIDMHTPDEDALKGITGLQNGEIRQLREEAQTHFKTMINAAVQELAEQIQESPEMRKRFNITDEEAASLIRVYQKAQSEGQSVIDSLDSEMRKSIETTVTNVLLDDGLKGHQQLWQKKIKPRMSALERDEKFAEKVAHKAAHEGFAGDELRSPRSRHTRIDQELNDDMGYQHAARLQNHRAEQAPWNSLA